jgi:hypothetical protein
MLYSSTNAGFCRIPVAVCIGSIALHTLRSICGAHDESLFCLDPKPGLIVAVFTFPAAFNLDFYTEVLDLDRLMLVFSEDPFFERYRKLNQALCDVIQEHSLVSFHTLDIQVPVWL